MKLLRTAIVVLVCWLIAMPSWAADGLVAVKSPHSVKETIDRFEAAAKTRGLSVLLRVDHAAGDCGPVVANLVKALAGLAQEAVR